MAEIQVAEILCEEYGLMPTAIARVEGSMVDSGTAFVRLCSLNSHSRVYVRLHLPTFVTIHTDD